MSASLQAAVFRQLHQQAQPLRLPNVWDAGSAAQIESLGAQAVATSSAAVAWSLGYPDSNTVPMHLYLAQVALIARVIRIPISVDIESGYSRTPEEVGEAVARFIDLGAIAINIQDGTSEPDLLARKIEAARHAGETRGVPLFINARTDVYARDLVPQGERVAEVLRRAAQYEAAGADGLFVLGLTDTFEMRSVADGTPLALSLAATPGLPPVGELGAFGVRRVSMGSLVPQALWLQAGALVSAFLADGRSEPLVRGAGAYEEINSLFRTATENAR
ncbi:PEP phosphonomutase [Bordetella genomosp. 1]|uniref:PEP phosphonomutase n=1 Tax=Bordetella genomosp. 1 TaxID=1395607 RepID=A0A261S5N9_9BORD|nr:isocitrate lyase/phosphoenolpyruvate mutase family protein [Bordetella genomosp. 1]MDQ8033885.1 isocitrate lyase/phosphoenolpyruvate mutase family protein [Bordetella sp.]OZI32679.1 PEP phosphonomutase [Bordetella genomosp. 1]OZI65966.1 PEP phosphonomutase [Bordetella genomosp. 1]